MVMEYIDRHMEMHIMDKKKRVKKMAMDTIVFRMVVNIMDSLRMIIFMEKEFIKKMAKYTKLNMKRMIS
jgi:hypothetical protein